MALASEVQDNPRRQPRQTPSEQRIADAVVVALELRFARFEDRMDRKFTDHMTEIEEYYSQRDIELQKQIQENRDNMAAINTRLESIEGRMESVESKLDTIINRLNGDIGVA